MLVLIEILLIMSSKAGESCIFAAFTASLIEICCQGTLHLLATTTEPIMLKSLNVTIINYLE